METKTSDALLQEILPVSGVVYLSDLHSVPFSNQVKDYIRSIPTDSYSLGEWNKAASYLLNRTICCVTVEEVKHTIIQEK